MLENAKLSLSIFNFKSNKRIVHGIVKKQFFNFIEIIELISKKIVFI